MFIDARTLPNDTVVESDICIIGGGAAGITLAKEFTGKSYRVCILESGGLELDSTTQSLADGKNVGLPYFALTRASTRYLGGNTNRWGSWCTPFDDMDFEHRPWVSYSGWPFTKRELIPYYERAQSVCKLRSLDYYDPTRVVEDIGNPEVQVLPLLGNKIVTKMWQFHLPAMSFGQAYKSEIERASNIDTYLHATVVDVEANNTVQMVRRVRVASLSGNKFWVASRIFILAMGGIENPRLLLASNKIQSAGLGNQNDLVGRFFMEHPHLYGSGKILFTNPEHYPVLYTTESQGRYSAQAGLCPSRELQEQEKILNYIGCLTPSSDLWANTSMSDEFSEHVSAIVNDFGYLANRVVRKLSNKPNYVRPRRMVLDIITKSEQAPNPDSRITLSREQDRLGVNRAQLDWRLTSLDKRTILRMQQAIGMELGRADLGRLKIELSEDNSWPVPLSEGGPFAGGWHQMGTTRMHIDPKRGVVDQNCRVHGISNLYIAGSSVFPTGGFANPTLTLLALTIRLADHLNAKHFPT